MFGQAGFELELVMQPDEIRDRAPDHPFDVAVLKLDAKYPLIRHVFRICHGDLYRNNQLYRSAFAFNNGLPVVEEAESAAIKQGISCP